jgi:hypothetical protein
LIAVQIRGKTRRAQFVWQAVHVLQQLVLCATLTCKGEQCMWQICILLTNLLKFNHGAKEDLPLRRLQYHFHGYSYKPLCEPFIYSCAYGQLYASERTGKLIGKLKLML